MFLRDFLHIYIQALKMMFVIAVLRVICLAFITDPVPDGQLWSAFLMALRFDWLIVSFMLLVPWLGLVLLNVPRVQKHSASKYLPNFIIWYWKIVSGLTIVIWFVNGFYFSHQRNWMWLSQWKTRIVTEPLITILISACVFTVLFFFKDSRVLFWRVSLKSQSAHGKSITSAKEPHYIDEAPRDPSRRKFIAVVMISALILLLGARGTLTAHHLRYEHSLLTKNAALDHWILSPLWTMSKDR